MDQERFDRITRTLATGQSRRRVLGLLTGGLAAAFGGGTRSSLAKDNGGGNSGCAARCKELYPPGRDRGQCIAAGARGEGPCVTPPPPPPPPVICGGVDCQAQLGDNDCTTTQCIVVEIGGVPTPLCFNDIRERNGLPCAQGGPGICLGGFCRQT